MGQDNKDIRINKIARELNVGVNTIVDWYNYTYQRHIGKNLFFIIY